MNYTKKELIYLTRSYTDGTLYERANWNEYTKEALMQQCSLMLQTANGTELPRQLPCMLARNFLDLPAEEQHALLESGNYVIEEKYDGVRAKLHLKDGKIRIDSRHRSTETFAYVDRTENFPQFANLAYDEQELIFDGELIMPCTQMTFGKTQTTGRLTCTTAVTNSQPDRSRTLQSMYGDCQFKVFDLLYARGYDMRNKCFLERHNEMQRLVMDLNQKPPGPVLVTASRVWAPQSSQEYTEQFMSVVTAGGEGLMLKHRDMPYAIASGSRTRAMYKWKKGQEIDCIVTGFVPGKGEFEGLVGALIVSVWDEHGAIHPIGAVNPGPMVLRKKLLNSEGELDWPYHMEVVEVSFQEWTKNNHLRHPVLKRWRPEKTSGDCILHGKW